jgi:hypothetical protein
MKFGTADIHKILSGKPKSRKYRLSDSRTLLRGKNKFLSVFSTFLDRSQ